MLGEINTAVVAASYFLTLIIKLESISTSGNLGVVKNIISEYDLDDENAEAYREKFIAFIDKLISEKKRRERKMIIARISPDRKSVV